MIVFVSVRHKCGYFHILHTRIGYFFFGDSLAQWGNFLLMNTVVRFFSNFHIWRIFNFWPRKWTLKSKTKWKMPSKFFLLLFKKKVFYHCGYTVWFAYTFSISDSAQLFLGEAWPQRASLLLNTKKILVMKKKCFLPQWILFGDYKCITVVRFWPRKWTLGPKRSKKC
jgi:hypothetical protein